MATALIAIILVVASLDYFSGWVRQRIIEGGPTVQRRSGLRTIARAVMVIVFIAAFIWSWRIARIDLIELVRGAPDGLRIAQSFTVPDMFDRPQQRTTLSRPLPVPCESGETGGGDANLTLTPPAPAGRRC